MKNVAKNIKIVIGIIFALTLLIGVGVSENFNKPIQVYAATAPYNNQSSTDGVRIDGWRALRDMTTYGRNTDNGCGYTAMAILLQYYNDNTWHAGNILPDDFNYKMDAGTLNNNARANALRGYSLSDAPVSGYVERNDDLNRLTPSGLGVIGTVVSWFTSERIENATISENHSEGFNNFFQTHCPNLNITATYKTTGSYNSPNGLANYTMLLEEAKDHIDNNRPIVLTVLNYNETYQGGGSGKFIDGGAHVVVAYGYRMNSNGIEFLTHSGWFSTIDHGTEVWFSENEPPFVYGFAYIDAPTDSKYNYTVLDNTTNDGSVRIDGLKYQHSGVLEIPSKIDGMNVTEINANAFSGQTDITSIEIPDTVIDIGNSAFAGLSNITSVTFANGSQLQTIGNSAFAGVMWSELILPNSVINIGNNAFSNCSNLTSINKYLIQQFIILCHLV